MSGAMPVQPKNSAKVSIRGGKLQVPDNPAIPFIEGDGTGPDIWRASVRIMDAAVKKAYSGKREIKWMEVYAGEKSYTSFGTWLPEETVDAFREYLVGIKGPLTTPIGGGIRSLNVELRQLLDLYVCLRPVRWFKGVPAPVTHPERVNIAFFRENTEDIYAGLEFQAGTAENRAFLDGFRQMFPQEYEKIRFPNTSGIGIKPVSSEGTERLVRAAINYALANRRRKVTLVHGGGTMKFTEGAFCQWGYNLSEREFPDRVYTGRRWERVCAERGEDAANDEQKRSLDSGKVLVNDMSVNETIQRLLLRADEFEVIATLNVNGDYLSDAVAAQIGGIGIAPGANINYETGHAVFEATHGTAPKYTNLDVVNPGSVVLSGEMMLRYMCWEEAADLIVKGMDGAIGDRIVTYDFARLMDNANKVKCSEFGDAVIAHM